MFLKDNIVNVKGHFKVEMFKTDGSVEVYEDKNLIMDTARNNMAELIGGYTEGNRITKFSLGNKGHNGTDILDYKKVGENNEFISSRTKMFSEDPAYDDENNQENFVYEIKFDSASSSATITDSNAQGSIVGSSTSQTCEVKRVVSDRTCTFTITVPDIAGNPPGEGAVIAYTEASLYAGNKIFSMKTFPARVKEDTVKLVITWAIIF
jgi:hypothetical protein